MIKSLTVTNQRGESIELELTRPDKTGFIVKSVEGLGPVKASVNTTELATCNGVIYNSSHTSYRNIVITLEYFQIRGLSIEDLRHKSYEYFPEQEEIEILIETDKRSVTTKGIVEHNEVNIWSQNEGSVISIICPDPYLYSLGTNVSALNSIEPTMEFEFSNESLIDPTITMGDIIRNKSINIRNEGDASTGVTITIRARGEVEGTIALYNISSNESMYINFDKLPELYATKYGWDGIMYKNGKYDVWAIGITSKGVEENDEELRTSGLIPAVPGTDIEINNMLVPVSAYNYISFYDEYGDYLSGIIQPRSSGTYEAEVITTTVTIPGGVSYFRITQFEEKTNTFTYKQLLESKLLKNDVLIINTNVGEKSVNLLRENVFFNILHAVNTDADWFVLKKGNNTFSYMASGNGDNLDIIVENKILYRGI